MDTKTIKLYVQIAVTGVFGIVAIYCLLTQPDNSFLQKWGVGTIGVIFGYWLK